MSDVVYGREECYERDARDYKTRQSGQLTMFDVFEPTEEQIFEDKVNSLKGDIWEQFQGKTDNRLNIHAAMLGKWFGKVKGAHFTRAIKEMRTEGKIVRCSGRPSNAYTCLSFKENTP